jgi:hypothetical protein
VAGKEPIEAFGTSEKDIKKTKPDKFYKSKILFCKSINFFDNEIKKLQTLFKNCSPRQ